MLSWKFYLWNNGLIEVGPLTLQEALTSGLTGVMYDSTGNSLGFTEFTASYENYNKFDFNIPIGTHRKIVLIDI